MAFHKKASTFETEKMPGFLPLVSVIIPVYNAEKFIARCLEKLMDQYYPKENLEIIVVDNASTDSSASIIKTFNVKYVFCSTKGPSSARNLGISEAKGEYLLFIDSDCLADRFLVFNHIQTHLKLEQSYPSIKAVGGGISGYNANFWAVCDDFCSWYLYHPALKPKIVTTYHPAANFSISRKIINEIGMFDEEHLIAEDVLFCNKLINKGYLIYFEPKAKVQHINRTSFKSFLAHAKQWAQCDQMLKKVDGRNGLSIQNKVTVLLQYLYCYFWKIIRIIYYCLKSGRFYVIFFIPFIIVNKTYFGYHKLKYGRVF